MSEKYLKHLPKRSREIYSLVKKGHTYKEIGKALGISTALASAKHNWTVWRLGAIERDKSILDWPMSVRLSNALYEGGILKRSKPIGEQMRNLSGGDSVKLMQMRNFGSACLCELDDLLVKNGLKPTKKPNKSNCIHPGYQLVPDHLINLYKKKLKELRDLKKSMGLK